MMKSLLCGLALLALGSTTALAASGKTKALVKRKVAGIYDGLYHSKVFGPSSPHGMRLDVTLHGTQYLGVWYGNPVDTHADAGAGLPRLYGTYHRASKRGPIEVSLDPQSKTEAGF
jgi:hypothetical protein